QAMDASLTLQSVVGLIDLDATQTTAADVDGNGAVQAMDASYILQYVVGLITEFPIEAGREITSPEASIEVQHENNELIFTTTGNLFGCDIAINTQSITIGEPIFVDTEMMFVSNTENGVYKLSFCRTMISENNELFRLPITTDLDEIIVNLVINTKNAEKTILLAPTNADNDDINSITQLIGNYPNPFSTTTTISFNLNNKNTANAEIEIFNLKGQLVKSFAIANGETSVEWNASNQPSGIYFYKMKTDDEGSKYTSVKKMIILK
ncbi:MAG: T9SS type A sorting domain-containing protein, partial [Candidatus Cloacimonetes bacterium]|nr:T9SS type A sorting domain-containing protein [Candidatus Cloacimonadota bacterium]